MSATGSANRPGQHGQTSPAREGVGVFGSGWECRCGKAILPSPFAGEGLGVRGGKTVTLNSSCKWKMELAPHPHPSPLPSRERESAEVDASPTNLKVTRRATCCHAAVVVARLRAIWLWSSSKRSPRSIPVASLPSTEWICRLQIRNSSCSSGRRDAAKPRRSA